MDKRKRITSFSLGEIVEIPVTGRKGRLREGPNQKGQFLVEIGNTAIWIDQQRIKPCAQVFATKLEGKKTSKKLVLRRRQCEGKSLSIDLHGDTRNVAIEKLQQTIERAVLEDISRLEIIHGKGSGVLQKAVARYLSSCHLVKRFQMDPVNPGVTLAYF